ncbi:MAG: UGMP family protein [Marine Group II euryarchaeote MED-G38]|nr:UGMP family protein [Euryarchaeota archaeon]OUV26099.1 MAG: UGMP family protein [Euryarchaeota archaeon TMED97]PDH22988.1 MAG: UGMP family protein [Marine Group II euryarchaeote MED-G38]|tara:strand:- start:47928 stop:48935 length:1008 start_codon:yes stop_codon:yes gene_type:complete
MKGAVLGIESTAHTLSFGMVDMDGKLSSSFSNLFRPEEGGIHPREAADHHCLKASNLLENIMSTEFFNSNEIEAVAFSQGPGLGPCLRVGASIARTLSKVWNVPLIGVNHCVAHIEIGKNQTGCKDPVLLYVSGGNTQVIASSRNKYRVMGETLDIGIGNMLDKFARTQGIPFPGGPEIEILANRFALNHDINANFINLPYGVQGMDIGFSGMLTAAERKIIDGNSLESICWSLQEHAFASCIEVAERAMAHTGKNELLLGGGVACNSRIREMAEIMCEERGAKAYWPEKRFCIDNGTMIAELGRLLHKVGYSTNLSDSAINPMLRTDHTEIIWD